MDWGLDRGPPLLTFLPCTTTNARAHTTMHPPYTQRAPLGASDLVVSNVTLGTMTFGEQTPRDEAHRILSLAADAGICSLDTAEVRARAHAACDEGGGGREAAHTSEGVGGSPTPCPPAPLPPWAPGPPLKHM